MREIVSLLSLKRVSLSPPPSTANDTTTAQASNLDQADECFRYRFTSRPASVATRLVLPSGESHHPTYLLTA